MYKNTFLQFTVGVAWNFFLRLEVGWDGWLQQSWRDGWWPGSPAREDAVKGPLPDEISGLIALYRVKGYGNLERWLVGPAQGLKDWFKTYEQHPKYLEWWSSMISISESEIVGSEIDVKFWMPVVWRINNFKRQILWNYWTKGRVNSGCSDSVCSITQH